LVIRPPEALSGGAARPYNAAAPFGSSSKLPAWIEKREMGVQIPHGALLITCLPP